MGLGVVVALPGDFDDGHVGEGVGVVGAEGGYALEGLDGGGVLLGIEERDAVVVPAHPDGVFLGVLILFGSGRDRGVFADFQGLGGGGHVDDGLGVVLLHHGVINEVLIEAAIADSGGEGELTGGFLGQAEAVAHQLRAAGLDGVVVGQDLVVPDLM